MNNYKANNKVGYYQIWERDAELFQSPPYRIKQLLLLCTVTCLIFGPGQILIITRSWDTEYCVLKSLSSIILTWRRRSMWFYISIMTKRKICNIFYLYFASLCKGIVASRSASNCRESICSVSSLLLLLFPLQRLSLLIVAILLNLTTLWSLQKIINVVFSAYHHHHYHM